MGEGQGAHMEQQGGELHKIYMAEVLLEAAFGAKTSAWFEGRSPLQENYRRAAASSLLKMGLLEKVEGYPEHPRPYRLTGRG